jgi:hypothetical protein
VEGGGRQIEISPVERYPIHSGWKYLSQPSGIRYLKFDSLKKAGKRTVQSRYALTCQLTKRPVKQIAFLPYQVIQAWRM